MKRKYLSSSSSSSSELFSNEDGGETRNMCLSSKYCNQENVLEEILLRLRVKPLHRCMSLSKSLRSLISSYYFHQKYRKYRIGDDSKILMGFFSEHIYLKTGCLPFDIGFVPTSSEGERLIEQGFDASLSFLDGSTADGLMPHVGLVSNLWLLLAHSYYAEKFGFHLTEPSATVDTTFATRLQDRITLPNSPGTISEVKFETFTCCGDDYPCLDWVTYKVVCGSDISKQGNLQVEIFSSQTGQWVTLQLFTPFSCRLLSITSVMNELETVCLVAFPYIVGDYLDAGWCWPVFNAKQKTNELQIVKSPRPVYDLFHTKLVQSQGFIYMANTESVEFELWELNEDEGIWVLKYRINPVEMFSQIFETTPYFLGLDPSNSALALVVVDTMIVLVDMKKKSYKSYVLSATYPDYHDCYIWHPYQCPIGIQ